MSHPHRSARFTLLTALVVVSTLAWGCRADSGPDDYDSQEVFPEEFVPEPEPALPEGELRLGIGVFYEGQTTDRVPIDNAQTHFYIFEGTFSTIAEPNDRVEGAQCDRITHAGGPWWGGGVHWDTARDLSAYDTLHLSVKSSDPSFASARVGLNGGVEVTVDLADHGFATDGEWHRLSIPLSVFTAGGADLSAVTVPLLTLGDAGEAGDSLLIDGVYFGGTE